MMPMPPPTPAPALGPVKQNIIIVIEGAPHRMDLLPVMCNEQADVSTYCLPDRVYDDVYLT